MGIDRCGMFKLLSLRSLMRKNCLTGFLGTLWCSLVPQRVGDKGIKRKLHYLFILKLTSHAVPVPPFRSWTPAAAWKVHMKKMTMSDVISVVSQDKVTKWNTNKRKPLKSGRAYPYLLVQMLVLSEAWFILALKLSSNENNCWQIYELWDLICASVLIWYHFRFSFSPMWV